MKILVVAATPAELAPFIQWLQSSPHKSCVETLITGPGILLTTYHLTRVIRRQPFDWVIQAGIAGSFFDRPAGQVYQISQEAFADFGAMDGGSFTDIFSLGLMDKDLFPFKNGFLVNPFVFPEIAQAEGVTVNCASGNEQGIERIRAQYHPQVESLEGGAFFFVCLAEGISFLQLRSISNKVERRDRLMWNIPLAIQTLNHSLIQVFSSLMTANHG